MHRLIVFSIAAVLSVQLVTVPMTAAAGHHYYSRRKTCSRCGLQKYRYQHDNQRGRASVLAAADELKEVNLVDGDGESEAINKKPFHIPLNALQADHVRLENIGLSLYASGEFIATGTLNHDGGPDGSLQGNRVTIRLRAYADVPGVENVADAVVVWKTSHSTWVSKNRPQFVKIRRGAGKSRRRRHFEEISHVELELEYTRDR